ncbi:4Fe-4S binding protein [Geobacter sp.]|uniref:4Fe-4S binding protein n=1 Tax=Geobacter sp. TaxID=46610 RepID=UPI0027B8C6EE|nr:4Fe-4S binding protein [Geobacter sp.]
MSDQVKKRKVKEIKVNLDKCIGCRACELACSGFHAKPKYSSINPERSRVRVVMDLLSDVYVPIRAGDYTQAECSGRNTYTINGKEYTQCSFCSVSCPARDLFREPDSGLPLKCDMCEDDPTLTEPMCVQVCRCGALTYAEWEEEVEKEVVKRGEMEMGLESLVTRFGIDKVAEALGQISKG